jgi:AraC family transcriptional regulator, ethanolamine operon transcriptional activator
VQFAPGGLATLAEACSPRLPKAGHHAILRLCEPDQRALMAAIEAGVFAATCSPDLLARPAAVAALRDSMIAAVARALAGPASWVDQPRATGAHRRVVRNAVDAIAASPAVGWMMTDLSVVLGVAPRTLHLAFAAVYGCSPHTYLKGRRLATVRRALLDGGGKTLVKTVAYDHGFWHLGHFAEDYRAMFGEHPSKTRHATLLKDRGAGRGGAPSERRPVPGPDTAIAWTTEATGRHGEKGDLGR